MDRKSSLARSLLQVGGTLTIGFYVLFTLISWAFYPEPYGPLTHYLSRLGNYVYNPVGAWFYNAGCVITGLSLIPFFVGLGLWQAENSIGRLLILAGRLLGLCSAVGLMMIGVFSEDTGSPHIEASRFFFLLLFLVLFLVNVGLLTSAGFPKPVALYGILIDLTSLVLDLLLGGPVVEWIAVFGSLAYVGLVAVAAYRQSEPGNRAGE